MGAKLMDEWMNNVVANVCVHLTALQDAQVSGKHFLSVCLAKQYLTPFVRPPKAPRHAGYRKVM